MDSLYRDGHINPVFASPRSTLVLPDVRINEPEPASLAFLVVRVLVWSYEGPGSLTSCTVFTNPLFLSYGFEGMSHKIVAGHEESPFTGVLGEMPHKAVISVLLCCYYQLGL